MFPQIFGKYVLEGELASGGMARVYLATLRGAVGFEKRLVVKQIRPELALDDAFVERFVEEAKIAVELSHPNIVPVYELGVEQGIYYIAMELCEGLTLTDVLNDGGPLDPAEGAHVGIEICRALDYAHRRGNIVHRDVTPRNVLLDEEGAVRLIDFGIAAPVSRGKSTERIEVFGSPGHMPQEQIRGERLTAATDVFAVGALLIEAWTGRPPFRRESFEASAEALANPPPSLALHQADLAPIAEVVAQSVAFRAADRPQEAEALARKLREFSRQFDSGDVAKRLGARVQQARRRGQRRRPLFASSGPLTPASPPQAGPVGTGLGAPYTPATPPMSPTPLTPPMSPLTPPGAAPITRTFAARDDLVEWTRKIASVPPPGHDELESDMPATLPRASLAPPSAAPPAREEPAESDEPSNPPAVLEADGPATRAMLPGEPPKRAFGLLFGALLAGAAVALGALVWSSAERPPPSSGPRAPASAAPLAPSVAPVLAPPSSLATSSATVAPLPSAVVSAARLPSAAPSGPTSSKPTSSSLSTTTPSASGSADASPSAQLRLTADPQATVTVVGARVSRTSLTPVAALALPPGSYAITFRSPTYGAPVVAQVELTPGANRGVHADFRAAVPTVSVR